MCECVSCMYLRLFALVAPKPLVVSVLELVVLCVLVVEEVIELVPLLELLVVEDPVTRGETARRGQTRGGKFQLPKRGSWQLLASI